MNWQKKSPVPSNKELLAYVIGIGICALLAFVVHISDTTFERLRPDSPAARAGMTLEEYNRMLDSPVANIVMPSMPNDLRDEAREFVTRNHTEVRDSGMIYKIILMSIGGGLVTMLILRVIARVQFETYGYSEQWNRSGYKVRIYVCGKKELYDRRGNRFIRD